MSVLLVLALVVGPVLVTVLATVLATVLVAVLAGPPATAARPQPDLALAAPVRLRAVARTTGRWRVAGLVLGACLALYAVTHEALGRGLLLATPLLGLGVLVGVVAGELRVAPPAGPTRVASLETRRVRDYLPRLLTPVVGCAALALLGLLTFATAVATPDDLGRGGRWLTTTCHVAAEGVSTTSSTGPWPGSFYALPLGAAVAGGLLAAAVALGSLTRRPRQGEDHALDDALRRRAVAAVVAAVGLLAGVPLAGAGAAAAGAVHNSPCLPAGWRVLEAALVLLPPLGLAVAAWCTAVLARPAAVRPPAPAGVGAVP